MKVFFALLLVANIAFAVFQWLLPYDQLFVEKKKIPAGEQLQLLSRDRYKADYPCDIESLLRACERWLRALPRSEPRVSA